MTPDRLRSVISIIHHPRYGGLPTHYPALPAWEAPPGRWFSKEAALRRAGGRALGIYAHLPFCASRCSFCFLEVRAAKEGSPELDAYIKALLSEAGALAPCVPERAGNIYIGGGTPNLAGTRALVSLVEGLSSLFRLRAGGQVSMEANPDFFTPAKLKALKAAGVDLIMAGVQSFSPALMRKMNRAQHCGRVARAFAMMRQAGFDNVNADLLCGLPGQDRRGFLRDAELIARIRPEHVHINRYKPVGAGPADKAAAEDWRREGLQLLSAEGYAVVDEDSASLAPGRMNRQGSPDFQLDSSILGLGAGALSHCWGSARWQNAAAPNAYAASPAGAAMRAVRLTVSDEMEHWLINRFLRPKNVSVPEVGRRFGPARAKWFARRAAELAGRGLLQKSARGAYRAVPGAWFGITAGFYGRRHLGAVAERFGLGGGE